MNPRDLNRQFELKKLELEIAEKSKKPQSVLSGIYRELKQLQYKLVTYNFQKGKQDLDPV